MNLEQIKMEIEQLKRANNAKQVVGKFHKVSLTQFAKDYHTDDMKEIERIYNEVLTTPVRSSVDSAGHDFKLTRKVDLAPGESIKINTGIRAEIIDGWVLFIMPRSGLGSKFRMQLNNTTGVIDGDYFYANNEGHIIAVITNDGKEGKRLTLEVGDRFLQGIFVPYGITEDDVPLGKRTGGLGSSGLK